jgi:hypothetical protein
LGIGHDRTVFVEKGHLPCSKVIPNNIIVIDKSCAIIQYASGWTEASFH